MKLNFIDEVNYKKFCSRLLIMTWLCIAVVIFADTLTVFIDARYLGQSIFSAGMVNYVFVPSIINVLVMAAVHLLSYFFMQKKWYGPQACLYIIGITAICFVLARSNMDVSINMVFFVIPIVLSVMYLSTKLLIFTFGLSLAMFAANILLSLDNPVGGPNSAPFHINVEVSLVLMAIVFASGIMIINRAESLLSKEEELRRKKNEDTLTGYLNHSGFYNDLDETFKNAGKEKGDFSLAIIDIDNFTDINEEYGHEFGDQVIETIVSSINKSIVNSAKAYRYGGEEFALICRGQQEIVVNMVDTILREFRNKTELKLDVAVTASAGICEYDPVQFKGKREIFAALDEALSVAKQNGKNQFSIWSETVVR